MYIPIAVIIFVALSVLGFAMIKDYQKQLNQLTQLETKVREDIIKRN